MTIILEKLNRCCPIHVPCTSELADVSAGKRGEGWAGHHAQRRVSPQDGAHLFSSFPSMRNLSCFSIVAGELG